MFLWSLYFYFVPVIVVSHLSSLIPRYPGPGFFCLQRFTILQVMESLGGGGGGGSENEAMWKQTLVLWVGHFL